MYGGLLEELNVIARKLYGMRFGPIQRECSKPQRIRVVHWRVCESWEQGTSECSCRFSAEKGRAHGIMVSSSMCVTRYGFLVGSVQKP